MNHFAVHLKLTQGYSNKKNFFKEMVSSLPDFVDNVMDAQGVEKTCSRITWGVSVRVRAPNFYFMFFLIMEPSSEARN